MTRLMGFVRLKLQVFHDKKLKSVSKARIKPGENKNMKRLEYSKDKKKK